MTPETTPATPLSGLLDALRGLIWQGRQQALSAVDMVLAQALTCEFGRGFNTTKRRHMRDFFLAFSIRDAIETSQSLQNP